MSLVTITARILADALSATYRLSNVCRASEGTILLTAVTAHASPALLRS